MSWVGRFCRLAPVDGIAVERVRFDMQPLENHEISGVEYQQGTLGGFRTSGKRIPGSRTASTPKQVIMTSKLKHHRKLRAEALGMGEEARSTC
jgi:hypothetical protein